MSHPDSLPPLAELQELAHVVSLPLNTRFRGVSEREVMLFAGPNGWSEFAPFAEYTAPEASWWLRAAISHGWHAQPDPRRHEIAVNATVPAVSAARVPEVLARFPGCSTAKVKICEAGQQLADDVDRVAAVRAWFDAAGLPAARIRVDANGALTVPAAFETVKALADFGIDYIEQPCRTVVELGQLRRLLREAGLKVLVAADESVRKAADPLAVARAGACDVLVMKAAPLGGISRALDTIIRAGLPVVISSALDTSVGISAGVRLAAALPAKFSYGAHGLGTAALLDADIVAEPLLPRAGVLPVTDVLADPYLVAAHRASATRERWWRQRLDECYQHLVTQANSIRLKKEN